MLKILNLTYSVAGHTIFDHANITLPDGSKTALIGDNGTGKTTLLRLINRELEPDHGAVTTHGTTAYVRQDTTDPQLSGGEITRQQIERALYQSDPPKTLLLDEPTNNLDFDTREWVARTIKSFDGQVLFASHDRAFIDDVADHILVIENQRLILHRGNYSDYLTRVAQARAEQEQEYAKYNTTKKKLEVQTIYAHNQAHGANTMRYVNEKQSGDHKAWKLHKADVQTGAGKKVKRVLAKLSQLDPVEKPQKRKTYQASLSADLQHRKLLLDARNLSKSYGDRQLFDRLSLQLHTGERIHIAGRNGSGKSTLLKILTGLQQPDSGTVDMRANHGYVSQTISGLDENKTGLENFESIEPTKSKLLHAASTMDLTQHDLSKRVGELSRGQITKLAILHLTLRPLDLIVLDEPTNHIDIRARENIEAALQNYRGAIIIASHDPYFIATLDIDRTIML